MAFHHEDDTVTAVEAICQGTIEALRDDLQARLQVCVRHAVLALCNPENAEVVEKLFESPKDRVQRVIKEGGGDFQSHIPVALFRRLKALSSVSKRQHSKVRPQHRRRHPSVPLCLKMTADAPDLLPA
eukprot:1182917-Prorocentrum_minimum.AAC.2